MGIRENVPGEGTGQSEEEKMISELLAPVDKEIAEVRLKLSKGKLDQASMVAYRDRLKELEEQRNLAIAMAKEDSDKKA